MRSSLGCALDHEHSVCNLLDVGCKFAFASRIFLLHIVGCAHIVGLAILSKEVEAYGIDLVLVGRTVSIVAVSTRTAGSNAIDIDSYIACCSFTSGRVVLGNLFGCTSTKCYCSQCERE